MTRWRSWLKAFDLLPPESVRRLIWTGLAFLFVGLFVRVTWELHEDSELTTADARMLVAIASSRTAALNGPAVDVTALGSATVISLFSVVGVVLLSLNRDRRGAAYLTLGSLGAGAGTFALKHLLSRERPSVVPRLVEVSGYSYPSGHSFAATSFYLLLMFLSWRHYRSWQARSVTMACAAVVIGGVCFSRLYLGVHYPSDVLSGAFLGTAWSCLLTGYFAKGEHA